jgi:hypothetical protein
MAKGDSIRLPYRPLRPPEGGLLFDIEPDWRAEWWGMPDFTMGDARPQHRIIINFMTAEDVKAFAARTGLSVNTRSDTSWFPPQELLRGDYYYDGPPTDSRYPVCIPSKGRADCQKTGRALDRMGVTYKFFVEETEYEDYCLHVGSANVVKMPFHDLGQGSIPARNFIWDWCREREHKRHWTVDDNIGSFWRCTNNRRFRVLGGGFFLAMENFVDRYENIVMAGPHDIAFVRDREPTGTPFLLNSRVYSCILLDTSLPHRWHGRYNEDTDLSLRLLKDDHCTLLFRALCMDKPATVGVRGGSPLKGGNTDNIYTDGDHRRAFAESLREQHPDVVEVVWKFNRWHHLVDYSPFKANRPRLRPDVTPTVGDNEYGMRLVRRSEEQSSGGSADEEGQRA